MNAIKRSIGLMSGTSMDGIDVALIETDGEDYLVRGSSLCLSYPPSFRKRLQQGLLDAQLIKERHQRPASLASLERDLTLWHALCVRDFLFINALEPEDIDCIGFHGQTVLHRPDEGLTVQIGDGDLLCRETNIRVVYDMRAEDMRYKGQGAPLIPAYHRALAANLGNKNRTRTVFVNIGGISNLTYVGDGEELVAFDSGPGNALIDQWMSEHDAGSFDEDGATAMRGTVDEGVATDYLAHEFFHSNQRRSLDRGDFKPLQKGSMSLEDGARTLAMVTAAGIIRSAGFLPQPPETYIVSGGGRKNAAIMADLKRLAAPAQVIDADSLNFDGDAMEAEAWAYLAVRSLRGLPLTYPSTTGCRQPVSGGVIVEPLNRN